MLNFILFIISLILALGSSYFLSSIFKTAKTANSILYFVLILISQVILTIEILSILKFVNITGLLCSNIIVCLICLGISLILGTDRQSLLELLNKIFSNFITCQANIIKSIKQDKFLFILFLFFCFSSLISLILALFVPSNSWDGLAYHLARVGFWMQNETLQHFATGSIRQLVFPINSEIMILWPMVFLKRDYFSQFNQYLAYLGCLFVFFTFFKYLKFSTKRILWAIFILTSLPIVILESSSTQTDLIMAFLLFCSFYLFVFGTREKNKTALIFSAISYAIALGTKNTAIFFIPVLGIIYLIVSIKESGKAFYKPLLIFLSAIIPAFIILSSYNYILNFIDYGSFLGPKPFIYRHIGTFGIKSFIVNMVKYLIFFFDFSGMHSVDKLSPAIMSFKDNLLHFFGLNTNYGLAYKDIERINTIIHENYSTFGILGFLLILPFSFRYCLGWINFRKDKLFYLCFAGFVIPGFLVSISSLMGFSIWNNRYLTTAVILGAPVLMFGYTRRKTLFKILITGIVIFNYLIYSTMNTAKPLPQIISVLYNNPKNFRNEMILGFTNSSYFNIMQYLYELAPNNSSIGLILGRSGLYYPFFEYNPTWKIHSIKYEKLFKLNNYNDYDFLIIEDQAQCTELEDFKSVKYDYSVDGNRIVFHHIAKNAPNTYYLDKNDKIITSGLPATSCKAIDFFKFPNNFSRVKVVDIEVNYKYGNGHDRYLIYVYKKLKGGKS